MYYTFTANLLCRKFQSRDQVNSELVYQHGLSGLILWSVQAGLAEPGQVEQFTFI